MLLSIDNSASICIVEEVDTVTISRKVILADLLKSLGGSAPTYVTTQTSAGFYSCAKAAGVYGIRGNTRLSELRAQHIGAFCSTQNGAEEQAAELLIECLKSEFSFEVDDINWSAKNQYDHDRDGSNLEIEKLRKENRELKEIVDVLKHGWSTIDRMLRSVQGMASSARWAAFLALNTFTYIFDPRAAMREVMNHVAGVEEYIARTLAEGSKDFNRAARMEELIQR